MSYLNFIFQYPNIGTEEGVTQVGSQTGLGKKNPNRRCEILHIIKEKCE